MMNGVWTLLVSPTWNNFWFVSWVLIMNTLNLYEHPGSKNRSNRSFLPHHPHKHHWGDLHLRSRTLL